MKRKKVFDVQIDGKEYAIRIKSGPWSNYIIIFVDDVERIKFKTKARSTPKVYFRLPIGSKTVLVSVLEEDPISHTYDVFVDDVSVSTGESLSKPLEDAKEFVKLGMRRHLKDNSKNLPIICIGIMVSVLISCFFDGSFKEFKFISFNTLAALAVLLVGGVIIFLIINIAEFITQKHIIKRWDQQFLDEQENI